MKEINLIVDNALQNPFWQTSYFRKVLKVHGIKVNEISINDADENIKGLCLVSPTAPPETWSGWSRQIEPIPNILSGKMKKLLSKGNVWLVVDYCQEGYPIQHKDAHRNAITCMQENLKKCDIPEHKCIIITGNYIYDTEENIYHLIPDCGIHIINYSCFEDLGLDCFQFENNARPEVVKLGKGMVNKEIRPKKFLSLNRRPYIHRILMILNILKRGMFDDCLVSFPNKHIDIPLVEHMVKAIDKSLLPYIQPMQSMPPIKIDDIEPTINQAYNSESWFYEQTYFSMTTETRIDEFSLFPSEKIFKPIIQFHPFIVMGNPGLLDYLNSIGYKTFHPYINESYDKEVSIIERFNMVMIELQKLCNMSMKELHDWYWNLMPILEHNYEWCTKNRVKEFDSVKERLTEIMKEKVCM